MIETRKPSGVIQRERSGESGKCWRPPVREPIPTARIAPAIIVFDVFVVSSSRSVPIVKATTHTIPVNNERVPEKNQWDIAPVIKLIPIYLIIVEKWAREKVIQVK